MTVKTLDHRRYPSLVFAYSEALLLNYERVYEENPSYGLFRRGDSYMRLRRNALVREDDYYFTDVSLAYV